MSSKSLLLAILAVVALLAPAAAAVVIAPRDGVVAARIVREAGDFGPRGFARLSDRLSAAERALTQRLAVLSRRGEGGFGAPSQQS